MLFDAEIPEAQRKAAAACQFLPAEKPTLHHNHAGAIRIEDRMELHRSLMCGTGFYEWMTRAGRGTNSKQQIPTVDFLSGPNDRYIDALIDEALPHDRTPFLRYMSDRPLGLGIITAVNSTFRLPSDAFADAVPAPRVWENDAGGGRWPCHATLSGQDFLLWAV